MPPPSAAPGRRGTRLRIRLMPAGAGAAVTSLGSRHSLALLDLGDDALVGIEELVVDLRPPAELGDLEQLRRRRVLRLVHEARDHRAVALCGEDLLRLLGAGEVDERLSRRVAV